MNRETTIKKLLDSGVKPEHAPKQVILPKIIPLQKLEPNMGEAQAVLCVGRVLFEHPLFMFGTYDQATQSLPHTL